jgi:hypothetical protein
MSHQSPSKQHAANTSGSGFMTGNVSGTGRDANRGRF